MNRREMKLPITRLKNYLNEVGVKVSALAALSYINPVHLHKCLNGEVDLRNGTVRTMSDENLKRLQEALHQIALDLRHIFIFYNDDLEVKKRNGRRYCPDCVEQIKTQLSPYFNIVPFIQYSLGWNYSKARNVLDLKNSVVYGNVSQENVERINWALAEISARLDLFVLTK